MVEHLDPGIYQQRTEYVDGEMEPLNESDAGEDKDDAHDQSPYYTPEEHFVLVFGGYLEVGKEFEGLLAAFPVKDDSIEDQGKKNPDKSPGQGLFQAYLMSFPVENAQVKRQHEKNEGIKEYPENNWFLHKYMIQSGIMFTMN